MAIEYALIPPNLPKILMSPDMQKIQDFAGGNLGIADTIKKSFNLKTLGSVKDLDALRVFVDKGGLKLPNSFDSYISDNKLKINLSDIDFKPSQNFNGLKSLEITTIKSIFETQKPYMEIIGLVTKSMVDIEDSIARLLALADSSLKPKFNDKALGFQFKLFKSDTNKLINLNSDKNKNSSQNNLSGNNGTNIGLSPSVTTEYEIVSIEYSTGEKKDNVNYQTIYHDIKETKLVLDDSEVIDNYKQPKPLCVAFSITDKTGISFDPPEWLKNSGKWYGQFKQLGGYSYIWKRDDQTVVSSGVPDNDTYGGGWENTEEKVFNAGDKNKYAEFFNFKLEDRLANINTISESYKNEVRTVVNRAVNTQGQLNSISEDGFLLSFPQKQFEKQNASYLPNKVNYQGKDIVLDPEAEFDLKIIKIDSTLDIAFFDNSEKRISTKIQRFLFNNYELNYSDDAIFDFKFLNIDSQDVNPGLSGSNLTIDATYVGVDKVSFDNLVSDKLYEVELIRREAPSYFRPIFWKEDDKENYDLDYPRFQDETTITDSVVSVANDILGAINDVIGTSASVTVNSNPANTYNYVYKNNVGDWIYGIYDVAKNTDVAFVDIFNNPSEAATSKEDGRYTIPLYGDINVSGGKIYGWYSTYTELKIVNGQKIVNIMNDDSSSINTSVLEEGSIKVESTDSRFGLVINKRQIRNEHLQISDPYDKNLYDYGTTKITQLFRYRTSLDDVESYYIIEGFDLDAYEDSLGNNSTGSTLTGTGYYKKRHSLGAPGTFVGVIITIMTKLIPKIQDLLDIIKDPASFITKPIIEKLGESFELLDPNIISDFNSLKNIDPKERFNSVKDNYQLFKYVDVNELTGDFRHILDGRATTTMFGIEFGLELKELIVKLIFKNNNKDLLDKFKSVFENQGLNGKDINSKLDLGPSKSETIVNTVNGVTTREEVDIIYSTGVKKDNIDYKYIYVTQYVQELINKYEEFHEAGDFDSALDALTRAQEADPLNEFIKDLIDKLKAKLLALLNPLMKLILELVTMPMKLIKGIIDFIMDLFKSISIDNAKDKLEEFVSFKWLLEMMSPEKLLGLIGLKMDIGLLNEWKRDYKSYDANYIFDLSKILTIPLFAKLPKVNKDVFPHMMNLLCDTINSMLTLIQGIINSIIDLIWSLVSLDALIPVPHLNITLPCANNNKYSISQLFDILNANGNGNNSNNGNGLFDFLYDVKLPDGRSIQDLDRIKLDEFIKNNGDLEFNFNF